MDQRTFVYSCARVVVGILLIANTARAADITVPAGGDLQAALDAARPGDTIYLAAGATYVGNFVLPVHGGTSYITVRTASSSGQPASGVRITPAHAAHLAKIRTPRPSDTPWIPALSTAPGAAYWRIMLVEFLANEDGTGDIIKLGDATSAQNTLSLVPHHLVLDRVYVHGDALFGQKRGIALNSRDTSILNSHVSDIKAINQDTQAIAGANGPGPFRIENNYLEAAGNVFIYGGDDPHIPGLVPADLTFRGNVVSRPLSWRNPIVPIPAAVTASSGTGGTLAAGTYGYRVTARRAVSNGTATSARSAEVTAAVSAGGSVTVRWNAVANATEYRVYGRTAGGQTLFWTVQGTSFTDTGAAGTSGTAPAAGTVWQVKNLFELKNFRRAQVDYNLMENNWQQAQSGIAVLLTVRNQSGACTQCVVEDVTFEYNVVRNMGGGITILGTDYNHPSQQANNLRIRNNEFSGIDTGIWGGNGYFVKISEGPRDIVIDHNTIVSPRGSGIIALSGPPIPGFVYTNNVARHNSYGIQGDGQGYGNTAIAHYLPNAVIRRNVLAGGSASRYPADNFFPTVSQFEAHFVSYASADFALLDSTDWSNACTHGSHDLGANYDMLGVPAPVVSPVQILTAALPGATAGVAYSTHLDATGGSGTYRWSITGGQLPPGIALSSTGAVTGTPTSAGTWSVTVTAYDTQDSSRNASRAFSLPVTGSNAAPTVSLRAGAGGAIPAGAPVTVTADASDSDGVVTRVNFFIDGAAAGSDTTAPFTLAWTARAGGPFTFTATAVDDDGASRTSAPLTLTTTSEVVIYAADVRRMGGDYQLASDTTAAAGQRLWNPNRNAAKLLTAFATPVNYAEFAFYAEAGRAYHIWIRGRGQSNHWSNDSAFLQFSGSVDATGLATARIGTTSSMWYSVEEANGAGILDWGWQDTGFGLNVLGSHLYFAATGLQTLRIQPREDGLSIDQIVISPVRYLSVAPGLGRLDATIVPKP